MIDVIDNKYTYRNFDCWLLWFTIPFTKHGMATCSQKHVNSNHSCSLWDPASLSLRSGYALPYLTIKHVRQDQA